MSRPFPTDHPGYEVPALAATKSPKPHIRVMPANCGNPDCACQIDARTDLSTREVCDLLGVSFRQMDYVARTVIGDTPGSGVHRRWDDVTIDRLTVARALLDAAGALVAPRQSPWPQLVDAVMAAGEPTPGWVTLRPGGVVKYHGWPSPVGEVGISALWQPVRGEAAA